MAKITVNRLSTSNTVPTITGTVDFERIKIIGNTTKTQTIHVIVNYNRYKLFDGNLGLDETKTPNVWKLHFSAPLYPGTYEVEAQIIDVENNMVIASDESSNELTILRTYPTVSAVSSGANMSILQKLALVQGLMNGLNRTFGGNSGIGQNPSLHPNQDDQISSNLAMRGAQERDTHPTIAKSKTARQKKNVIPNTKPKPEEFKSTKPAGGAADAALAKAKETLGESSGLDATVDPGNDSWNSKIDETEKVLAEAQGKTDAMNETYDAAVESAGGDETKAMLALEPDSQAGIDTWVPNLGSVKAAVENTNG
jgi:hypothetical protein